MRSDVAQHDQAPPRRRHPPAKTRCAARNRHLHQCRRKHDEGEVAQWRGVDRKRVPLPQGNGEPDRDQPRAERNRGALLPRSRKRGCSESAAGNASPRGRQGSRAGDGASVPGPGRSRPAALPGPAPEAQLRGSSSASAVARVSSRRECAVLEQQRERPASPAGRGPTEAGRARPKASCSAVDEVADLSVSASPALLSFGISTAPVAAPTRPSGNSIRRLAK